MILSAGGFVSNREMMRTHAPAYKGGIPLGTSGDDGKGINLGVEAGGATDKLGNVSAWRFIVPPSAFLGSILVGESGARIVDESRYGAALGQSDGGEEQRNRLAAGRFRTRSRSEIADK